MSAETSVNWVEISDPQALPVNPLVSVHMITYNHAPYIADAIESVVNQETGFPIEIVIGEDCSEDNTRAIVLEYQSKYPKMIRVLLPRNNTGAVANYKRVAFACRGEYIAFCEGDDYWLDCRKLAEQIKYLQEQPCCGFVHTDFLYRKNNRFLRGGKLLEIYKMKPLGGEHALKELLSGMNPMGTCTFMIRNHLFNDFLITQANYISRYLFIDYFLLLYVAAKSNIGYMPNITGVYREVHGSATKKGPRSRLSMHRSMLQCRDDFAEANNLSHLLSIDKRIDELKILRALAYQAGDLEEYDRCSRLLIEKGFKEINTYKTRIRRFIMKSQFLMCIVRFRTIIARNKSIKETYCDKYLHFKQC